MSEEARVVRFAMALVALVGALAILTGCAFEPTQDTPLTPRPWFRAQWDTAQTCTGLRGRYEDLRFWSVPDLGGKAAKTFGKDIYIAEGYEKYPLVVKHEMIHALGIHDHPYHPFVDPCKATWESARALKATYAQR